MPKVVLVEAKLHDESRLIQRCFDDNKGDDKKLKGQFMIIKEWVYDVQDVQDWIKNTSRFKRKSWRTLQDSRRRINSRIKIQGSSFKNQDQDSRIKRRLNQDKYEKDFSKTE